MSWYGESICFNDDSEPIPCSDVIITSSDVSESLSEYCGDLGEFCNDEEYDEVFKAAYR